MITNQEDKEKESSIAKIEALIEEIRLSKNAKTKANVAELKRLRTVLKKVYAENKHKVMDFEKKNHGHLVLLCSTNGFYKMFENSLHFYAFDIAPKLNIEAKVLSDGDYEDKSQYGVTSVKNLKELEKKLGTLKIKRVVTKDKTGNIIMFKLPWEYSDKEIEKLIEQNSYDEQKFNHVIVAENIIPTLFLNLNELLKASYENVRRLEPVARETLGNYIITTCAEMVRVYIEMANGRMNELEGLKIIKNRLDKVKSQVKIIADLKLWNAKTYARIGEMLIRTQGIIENKQKNS